MSVKAFPKAGGSLWRGTRCLCSCVGAVFAHCDAHKCQSTWQKWAVLCLLSDLIACNVLKESNHGLCLAAECILAEDMYSGVCLAAECTLAEDMYSAVHACTKHLLPNAYAVLYMPASKAFEASILSEALCLMLQFFASVLCA